MNGVKELQPGAFSVIDYQQTGVTLWNWQKTNFFRGVFFFFLPRGMHLSSEIKVFIITAFDHENYLFNFIQKCRPILLYLFAELITQFKYYTGFF